MIAGSTTPPGPVVSYHAALLWAIPRPRFSPSSRAGSFFTLFNRRRARVWESSRPVLRSSVLPARDRCALVRQPPGLTRPMSNRRRWPWPGRSGRAWSARGPGEPWGTGKTSFMQVAEARLHRDKIKIKTVWFDAWKYSEKEAVWNALI